MPTSDGISDEDWNQIHEDAAAIVNASSTGVDTDLLDQRLLRQLDYLEEKYRRLPSLLATRADFIDNYVVSLSLLKEAYVISLELADDENTNLICLSLIEKYRETELEHPMLKFWADLLKNRLLVSPDQNISKQLSDYGY